MGRRGLGRNPAEEGHIENAETIGELFLPPGQWTEVSFDVGLITEERAQLILSKPPRLYFLLLGVACYSDIFAKDRPSTFRYLYSPELEIFINCPGGNTVP